MKAVVTGGGGFLGGALVRALLARGDSVAMLNRGAYPALGALGVREHRGDLAEPSAVRAAVSGADVVFHVAARAGIAGRPRQFHDTNVVGTANVLAACRQAGVGRLVFTSTPAVVHGGGDLAGADESLPYARRYPAPYPATKAAAERAVLAADGPGLATIALRPHLIWGPGDTQLTARILDRARAGRLRFVGHGRAMVDTTYIDNAVSAHLLAADALGRGRGAGRAYFISQGEPRTIAAMTNAILAAAGLPPERRSVPFPVAYCLGAALEAGYAVLGRTDEPLMTRFVARQLATDHWFDISAARRDLGYEPVVSIDAGLARLAQELRG